jgi:hypothetical protein
MKKLFEDGLKPRLNYTEFGKLMINLKLLNNNILLLKYKNSYGPVPGLLRTPISNEVKDLLYYIIDTQNVNYEYIRELEDGDRELIINILKKSGLDIIFRLDLNKTTENEKELIDRLSILQGEVEAGNNNIEILNESKEVLRKLRKIKRITEKQYNELIQSIEELKLSI